MRLGAPPVPAAVWQLLQSPSICAPAIAFVLPPATTRALYGMGKPAVVVRERKLPAALMGRVSFTAPAPSRISTTASEGTLADAQRSGSCGVENAVPMKKYALPGSLAPPGFCP